MNPEENELKNLLGESPAAKDENKALRQVLRKSSNITACRDVASLFVGWCWVILLGFGASAYSAKRRLDIHQQHKRPRNNPN